MKLKFWCDNNANIHSERSETFELEEFGYTEDEWNAMSEEEKQKHAEDWAMERFDFGFEELK
jgi:hypothetical protein